VRVEEALAIVDAALQQQHLTNLQEQVFRYCWEGKTYAEIASLTGYDNDYIRDVGFRLWQLLSKTLGRKITKSNAQSVLRSYAQQIQQTASEVPAAPTLQRYQDWGDALDVSNFYGRAQELDTLEQWVVRDHCRVVGLFGIGGVGKTFLSVKLGENLQDQFEFLIWRSLRNAPPIQELLASTIRFLSQQQEITLPESLDGQISRLLHYLRQHRCLLIMDNGESILQPEDHLGRYREGYEGYGQVLRAIGETRHQSCLVMTGREKSQGFSAVEGEDLPVRSLQLGGLNQTEGQQILKNKGLVGSEQDYRRLVQYYRGNPLALQITAASIRDLFGGNIPQFLAQGTGVFNGIRNLLSQQMQRLSELEMQVMAWLAINREPVSPAELQADLIPTASRPQILEALESLLRRSLIEQTASGFTQQPVVMEYMTEQLIEQAQAEITAEQFQQLQQYALIKAQTKDYVRESQTRVILEPLVQRLRLSMGSDQAIVAKLQRALVKLQQGSGTAPGYGGGNIVNLLRYLKVDLTGYDFSNLALWQAYLQDVTLHDANLAGADLRKSVFAETLGSVLAVAFSGDGQLLAAGDTNSEVRVWQVAGGKQLLTCRGRASWVWSVAFSPNRQTLASCDDKIIRLWDTRTGQCLKSLEGHQDWVYAVAFSPDGQTLASCSPDHTIKLWNPYTGNCLNTLCGHEGMVFSVRFSPDGRQVASCSSDNTIRLWDTETGGCRQVLEGHQAWVWSIAYSPDGQILASGSHDNTIRLWDRETGECQRILSGHQGWIWSVAFSPNRQALASGSDDNTVRLWSTETGQGLQTFQGHTSRVWSVAFSSDGQLLASGSEDLTVRLWDLQTHQCHKTLRGHANLVWSVAFSPDGQRLVSSSEDQRVRLWDLQTGQCLKTLQGHTSRIWSVAFSPDGQTLASSSDDHTVRLWSATTGACLQVLRGHGSWVNSVTFSPDGALLASGSGDQTLKVWDAFTGECLKTLEGHASWILSVAFSPDGTLLASGSGDQTIKLWDIATGECLQTLEGAEGFVSSVAFTPKGDRIIGSSGTQTVKVWNVATGELLQTLEGHKGRVWAVAVSPEDQFLASGSEDGTVKLWDSQTGACCQTLEGHSKRVQAVAFKPDSYTLASGSYDETIRLWNLQTGQCLQTLRSPRPYEGMKITEILGLNEAQKMTLKTLGAID